MEHRTQLLIDCPSRISRDRCQIVHDTANQNLASLGSYDVTAARPTASKRKIPGDCATATSSFTALAKQADLI